MTFTKKDGSSGTISTQDTVYTHPSSHPASMITGLATVATSGSYNDLNNKPSIPATPNAYVTYTYRSGSTWYRRWSDGFIEQGASGYQGTKSFPLAFSSTNYKIIGSCIYGDGYIAGFENKTTTGCGFRVQLHNGAGNGDVGIDWYAYGY